MNATEQRLVNLEKAERIRCGQAKVKRRVKARGADYVAALLRDPDELVGAMRLGVLLRAIPRYGRVRCDRLLRELGIHRARLDRRICELTERERLAVARGLSGT